MRNQYCAVTRRANKSSLNNAAFKHGAGRRVIAGDPENATSIVNSHWMSSSSQRCVTVADEDLRMQ